MARRDQESGADVVRFIRARPVEAVLLLTLLWPAWLFLSGSLFCPGSSATPLEVPVSLGMGAIGEYAFDVEHAGDYRVAMFFDESGEEHDQKGELQSPEDAATARVHWSVSARGESIASGAEVVSSPMEEGASRHSLGLGWLKGHPGIEYLLTLELQTVDLRWIPLTATLSVREPLAWELCVSRQVKGLIVGIPLLAGLVAFSLLRRLVARLRESGV